METVPAELLRRDAATKYPTGEDPSQQNDRGTNAASNSGVGGGTCAVTAPFGSGEKPDNNRSCEPDETRASPAPLKHAKSSCSGRAAHRRSQPQVLGRKDETNSTTEPIK